MLRHCWWLGCVILLLFVACSQPLNHSPSPLALASGQRFVTLPGGERLFERSWSGEGAIRSVVVLLHGSGSHGGALAHLGENLAGRGFAVYAFDVPGFGFSPGRRAVSPPFSVMQPLLADYLEQVRGRHPGLPLFLVGESMGGTLAVYCDIHGGLAVDGVVLCGAALDYPPTTNALLRGLASVIGWIDDDIPLVPINAGEFTRSDEVLARVRADPLMVTGRIPVGHVNVLMQAISVLRSRLGEVRVPFFIQHGSADRVAPLAAAEELFRTAVSPDKRMTIYPGALHAILHDPEWTLVADDMAVWMEKHSLGRTETVHSSERVHDEYLPGQPPHPRR